MGNCAACCGKADPNEINTEKQMRKSGNTKEGEQLIEEIRKSNKTGEITKIQASFRGH